MDKAIALRNDKVWTRIPVRRLAKVAKRKPLGVFGGMIVLVMVLAAIFADLITPYGLNETNIGDRFQSYSLDHWLGTDNLGRDVFTRVIYGARVSMYVGLGAVSIGTTGAVILGGVSGFRGGILDLLLQRVVDAWMSFPFLIILLTFIAIFGQGMWNVILALSLGSTFNGSRVVRGAVLSVKANTYVEAGRAIGCSDVRLMIRYILPNIMAPVIILATLALGFVILAEASISFLGFGIPPPAPSWGGMLSGAGRQFMLVAPWMAIWPGVALSLVVFGFNTLGDAVRDVLDPRLRGTSG